MKVVPSVNLGCYHLARETTLFLNDLEHNNNYFSITIIIPKGYYFIKRGMSIWTRKTGCFIPDQLFQVPICLWILSSPAIPIEHTDIIENNNNHHN